MALKNSKATTPPDLVATDINLEEAIADELLNDIDWQKVRSALLKKAPAKLFAWLAGGNDRPINISQYPELAVLPSNEDRAS